MSFKDNVDLYVEQSAKLLKFSDDLIDHIKSTHSLIKVNVINNFLKLFIRNIFI